MNKEERTDYELEKAQYDLKGNFIKQWSYIRQVQKELGISNSNIVACCKGKRKSAGGYIWKYN